MDALGTYACCDPIALSHDRIAIAVIGAGECQVVRADVYSQSSVGIVFIRLPLNDELTRISPTVGKWLNMVRGDV